MSAKTITHGALMKRLRRALKRDGLSLHTNRAEHPCTDLGRFYAVDIATNVLHAGDIDPEAWAREMGLIDAETEVTA